MRGGRRTPRLPAILKGDKSETKVKPSLGEGREPICTRKNVLITKKNGVGESVTRLGAGEENRRTYRQTKTEIETRDRREKT